MSSRLVVTTAAAHVTIMDYRIGIIHGDNNSPAHHSAFRVSLRRVETRSDAARTLRVHTFCGTSRQPAQLALLIGTVAEVEGYHGAALPRADGAVTLREQTSVVYKGNVLHRLKSILLSYQETLNH